MLLKNDKLSESYTIKLIFFYVLENQCMNFFFILWGGKIKIIFIKIS